MSRMRALIGETIAGEATERFRTQDPRTSLLAQRLRAVSSPPVPEEAPADDAPTDTRQRRPVAVQG